MFRRALIAGALLAAAHPSVRAQSPADRLDLARLRDSLAALADSTDLRRGYRLLARAGRDALDEPMAGLRLGLVALRLAELGADPDASEAVGRLRRIAEREPDWPIAWHALGLAEARRAGWEQGKRRALGSRVGVGTLQRAADRHHRALDADSGFTDAALALTEITLGLRDTARYSAARIAVRRAVAGARPPPAELLLAWGRIERAAGHAATADTAFARYAASGGNPALALLERARTGLAAGQAGVESLYFQGAASDDSVAVAGYRADLEPIADDSMLAWFDGLHGSERAEYLRRFWGDRDRYEMRSDGERLREHYRRLHHARRAFPLTVSRRFYGAADAFRSGSTELDDRGIVYLRHGEPTERLRPFVFALMPHESWRYGRAEGDLVLHFSAGYDQGGGGDLYDYRLVESVLDLRGGPDVPRDQLLLSRQSLSPLYNRMLNWGGFGAARARARERGMGRRSVAVGTSSDTYELQFARHLVAVADLIAVGSTPRGSLAHFVFAARSGGPTRVRLVAFPEDDGLPIAIDTTIALPRRPPGEGEYLVGRAELELPAGRWTWRASLAQADSTGLVLPSDSVRVAGGNGLRLSDLALGAPEGSARWHPTPADTVLLAPGDLLRAGSEVGLYYEAAGATAGAAYRHRVSVYRLRGDRSVPDRRPVVSLAFEEPAPGATIRAHRTLQLRRLKPGRYLVELRLTAPQGDTVVQRRELRVAE